MSTVNESMINDGSSESKNSELPKCKLVGTDGNVFAVIGTVMRALRMAGLRDRATEFSKRAMACRSYDDVLGLCFEFVDVV